MAPSEMKVGSVGTKQGGNVVSKLIFCGGYVHWRSLFCYLLDLLFARPSLRFRGWFLFGSCLGSSAFFFGFLLDILHLWFRLWKFFRWL